jgi:hypothetical protein
MSIRSRRTFAVLGFLSTHDALDAEEALLDTGLDVVVIPSVKSIDSLCGLALRLEPDELDTALLRLEEAGIEVSAKGEIEDI